MSTYARRVAAFAQHAAMLNEQMGDLRREGEALVDLYSALKIAFSERCHREFNPYADEFTLEDEARAAELLALLPGAGA